MSVGQHAANILSAWRVADRARVEAATESALVSCATGGPRSFMESEQREVLRSVAENLRDGVCRRASKQGSLRGAVALLVHLSRPEQIKKEMTGVSGDTRK